MVRRIFLILSPGVGARGKLGPMVVAFPGPQAASAKLSYGSISSAAGRSSEGTGALLGCDHYGLFQHTKGLGTAQRYLSYVGTPI
jgi:hypothetical protein